MAGQKPPITIDLTPEQKRQIKEATGADVEKMEVAAADPNMAPEELEDRVAPSAAFPTISIKISVKF
jgi:hypothetical protein